MTKTNIQLRGHCQWCGRDQAVTSGRMAHHGYTVESGYFQGVCGGHSDQPIEHDRTRADAIVVAVRKQAVDLLERADRLERLEIHPVSGYPMACHSKGEQPLPFAELSEYRQQTVRSAEVWNARSRAKAATEFATFLNGMADTFHGKQLAEVERSKGPAPIVPGERRKLYSTGSIAKVRYQQGGRVMWIREHDGYKGWTGTQAWRKFEIVEV